MEQLKVVDSDLCFFDSCICSSREGMLEFFDSDEKLDKDAVLRKTGDQIEVSPAR